MTGCIKISASRGGSGSCIKISVLRGEGCITIRKDLLDEDDIPPLPTPVIEYKFECFDLIGHGLNNFITIGKYIKTSDGTPVSSENIIARFTAIVGLGIEPVPVHNFDTYKVISDITEECYLNAFDTNSGLDNIAIMYPGGTKVRYFDWTLAQISLITDRHGYVYDAFYESDNEMMTGILVDKSISRDFSHIDESGYVHLSIQKSCNSTSCNDASSAAGNALWVSTYGVGFISDGQLPEPSTHSTTGCCDCSGDCDGSFTATVEFLVETYIRSYFYSDTNRVVDIYSIVANAKSREEPTMVGKSITSYYGAPTDSYTSGGDCVSEQKWERWDTKYNATTTSSINFITYSGRPNIYYFDGKISEKQYIPKKSIVTEYLTRVSYMCGDTEGGVETGTYDENPKYVQKYEPSKYIQLNGGDPHKIQTGQDWTAIGSACISTDRDFVCENLPTTLCGKVGAIVDDRVVIPTENAEGITALFSLDQSFIIDDHKIPAQIVL